MRVCAAATRSAAGLVASFRMSNVGSDLAALAAHCLRASSSYKIARKNPYVGVGADSEMRNTAA